MKRRVLSFALFAVCAVSVHAQVTYARAIKHVPKELLRYYEPSARDITQDVEVGSVYVFVRFRDQTFINHPADEFSIIRLDDFSVTVRTEEIELIRPSSRDYETVAKTYEKMVADKREREKSTRRPSN